MMYYKFALLLCVFGAAVVVAYDFKDADYSKNETNTKEKTKLIF